MLEAHGQEALNKGLRALWIIWAGMFGSLLIYIFICHQWGEGKMNPMASDFPIKIVRNAFYTMAVAALAVSYLLRRHMLKAQSLQSRLKHIHMTSDRATHLAVPLYTTAVVLSLAISESIGIYGLILFSLGDSLRTLYIFITLSALAMYYYRPRREELEQVAKFYAEAEGSGPDMKQMT